MNKMKKFYNDHKKTVMHVSVGLGVGVTIATAVYYKKLDGRKIIDINLIHDNKTGADSLFVAWKNGNFSEYEWQFTTPTP